MGVDGAANVGVIAARAFAPDGVAGGGARLVPSSPVDGLLPAYVAEGFSPRSTVRGHLYPWRADDGVARRASINGRAGLHRRNRLGARDHANDAFLTRNGLILALPKGCIPSEIIPVPRAATLARFAAVYGE
ncbi:MAG: hypothetical protein ACXW4O_10870 [Candidatus Binatia bacterium]